VTVYDHARTVRLGQQVQILLSGWDGVDDHLVVTREDQYDGLQQSRVGVEPESQFPLWLAVIIERSIQSDHSSA
jgi:hypothetical protein